MAPSALTSNLGVLSVINHRAAAVDGLQKLGVANVAQVHQIHVTPQQRLKRICQLGPSAFFGYSPFFSKRKLLLNLMQAT